MEGWTLALEEGDFSFREQESLLILCVFLGGEEGTPLWCRRRLLWGGEGYWVLLKVTKAGSGSGDSWVGEHPLRGGYGSPLPSCRRRLGDVQATWANDVDVKEMGESNKCLLCHLRTVREEELIYQLFNEPIPRADEGSGPILYRYPPPQLYQCDIYKEGLQHLVHFENEFTHEGGRRKL
ncbi:unnamed protein product [Spirodela intermedia]|uniref:Uncharacterized protein n=2 Tax=Spirodela intermedia TaxID=51605 RepID=A0A7I8L0P6_SPIIN|nr:unnamed protein product [Spirodela intermedia]CAA6666799.1 unnamed protein product [Spirodela intermedia]CAA7403603.1 unnamed protein product [Spirodela intermedia]